MKGRMLNRSLKLSISPYNQLRENPMQYVGILKTKIETKKVKTITLEEFNQI